MLELGRLKFFSRSSRELTCSLSPSLCVCVHTEEPPTKSLFPEYVLRVQGENTYILEIIFVTFLSLVCFLLKLNDLNKAGLMPS